MGYRNKTSYKNFTISNKAAEGVEFLATLYGKSEGEIVSALLEEEIDANAHAIQELQKAKSNYWKKVKALRER